ncbi:hypothetical protein DPPLL_25620 [Desulfofustis limnaeus]|uniref:Uncharacterized protein n=1 Tax=Desulfofustis limnaeus TaxID=2740163 RepID=A0ABN6MAS2_9BACT|nr:hypothetical protein DPPLL_25620 [Desulfofustis limnaeus]
MTSRAFLAMQPVLDHHSEQKEQGGQQDRPPGVEPLDTCHGHHDKGDERKKDEKKDPTQSSDSGQSLTYVRR